MKTSKRFLVVSTRYNNLGFISGLKSVLNQLLYAEKHQFTPVIYFNPWSNDFPDFNRQRLFADNQWLQYFQATAYSYEDILESISTVESSVSKRDLHFLSNEEMLYLDFGNPSSIYSGNYGFYYSKNIGDSSWLNEHRLKAQSLVNKYVKINPEYKVSLEKFLGSENSNRPLLGVVVNVIDDPAFANDLKTDLASFFNLIDIYVDEQPDCLILLVSDSKKNMAAFDKRYGARIKRLPLNDDSRSRALFSVLLLSECDFLIKDHSELGEFVLYFNPDLAYRDLRDTFKPLSSVGKASVGMQREIEKFRERWSVVKEKEGLSLKTFARLVVLYNPAIQIFLRFIDRYRFSNSIALRWIVIFIDFLKMVRAKSYVPMTRVKHRSFHAAKNIGADFYRYEDAPIKEYFEVRNSWDTNTGFFAYFMMALEQIKFSKTHELEPVVCFDEPHNHFYEPEYSKNMWENYFEPVSMISSSDLEKVEGRKVTFIDSTYHDRLGQYSDPPADLGSDLEFWFEAHRAQKAVLTKKYIKPKRFILDMVDRFHSECMSGEKVLGIHVRGTDKEVDQKGRRYEAEESHVRKIEPSEYFPYVDEYLSCNPRAKIFIATDQQQYLDQFIEKYGQKIITNNVMRTRGDEPLFRLNSGNKYLRGVEVLCDSLILSKCDYLFKGYSNVAEAAICFNPSIPVIDIVCLPDIDAIDLAYGKPAVSEQFLKLQEVLLR